MFATIVGALPAPPNGGTADREARLRSQLRAQADEGIELLSPGEPVVAGEQAVDGWRGAAAIARELDGPVSVKAALVGPFTADGGRPTGRTVERTRETITALVDAGCPFVEIHEPAATEIGADADARSRFRSAHERLTDALPGHLCLAIVGGNADRAGAETILAGGYGSFLLDLIRGPDNWGLAVAAPPTVGLVAGALDHRPDAEEVPETLVWAAHYAASTGERGMDRVALSTAGSLAALPWDAAIARLRVLVRGAQLAAMPRGEELARALDPRALDIRSAAAGRYAPLRRPGRRSGR